MIINPKNTYGYRETLEGVKRLSARYSGILKEEKSGKSELSREIPLLMLGHGKRKILAVSAIHGREWVTVNYLLKCLECYCEALWYNRLYAGFCLRKLFEEFTLCAVPMANPDSVEIALHRETPPKNFQGEYYLCKDNARGVNLNANFPFHHRKVPAYRHPGEFPSSEKETEFLINLCEKQNFEMMFSFHSRGNTLYFRDCGNREIKGDGEIAKALGRECGYTLEKPTQKPENYAGGFENWFRHKFRKPAFCVELVLDENRDFRKPFEDFEQALCFGKTRKTLLVAMQCLSQA
ncbi:MAG: M14 family zinc carboxypeptidase [Eubacteriales bacterium]|nr:M14 family zinc carboxypeptidase [Eubacteriales bacterium]